MNITPAGFVILLLALAAPLRRRWSIGLVLLSVPFNTLVAFEAIGHLFTFPEVAVIFLFAGELFRSPKIEIPKWNAPLFLVAFGIVCTLSVVALYVHSPENLLVHPYNISKGFGAFTLVPLEFTRGNITQLLMRWFVVGTVLGLGLTLTGEWLRTSVRWIVGSAVAVGALGIGYQIAVITGTLEPIAFLRYVGFTRYPSDPYFTGPIPRMYSIAGEPGEVANYLLYATGLTSTLALLRRDSPLLSRKAAAGLTAILVALVFLTTGTTGYGGVAILTVVLLSSALTFDQLSTKRAGTVLTVGVIAAAAVLALVFMAAPDSLEATVIYQIEKVSLGRGSGSLRVRYLQRSFLLFAQRPLIGVGVGSHHPTSILGTVAAETGLLGLLTFVGAIGAILWDTVSITPEESSDRTLAVAFFVAGVTLFATNLLARSASGLLFPWFWFSLAMPIALSSTRIDSYEIEPSLRFRTLRRNRRDPEIDEAEAHQ